MISAKLGDGTQTNAGTGSETDKSVKFKHGFGCWDVPEYPNGTFRGPEMTTIRRFRAS